jgi:hypothetical protein
VVEAGPAFIEGLSVIRWMTSTSVTVAEKWWKPAIGGRCFAV